MTQGKPSQGLITSLPAVRQGTRSAPSAGVVSVTRLSFVAWLTECATGAQLRILRSRRQVVALQAALCEDELEARRRLGEATLRAEDAEAERDLRCRLRSSSAEEARAFLQDELERERLLLARTRLRQIPPPASQVLDLAHSTSTDTRSLAAEAATPSVEVEISDRQIDALALKAVTRFAALPAEEAERAWETWKHELRRRLPPYAAMEVACRAEALRGLLRQGND